MTTKDEQMAPADLGVLIASTEANRDAQWEKAIVDVLHQESATPLAYCRTVVEGCRARLDLPEKMVRGIGEGPVKVQVEKEMATYDDCFEQLNASLAELVRRYDEEVEWLRKELQAVRALLEKHEGEPGPGEFRCDMCREIFAKCWTTEEAEKEAEETFGIKDAASHPEMARVCDVCYQKVMQNLVAKGETA
jgi:hypothetical protein